MTHFVFVFSLTQERNQHAQQENDSQQMISSLQKKIAEMLKQHTKSMDEIKRELTAKKQLIVKPISIPQFVQTDLSISDYLATIEKLRGNNTNAILKKSSAIVQVRRNEQSAWLKTFHNVFSSFLHVA